MTTIILGTFYDNFMLVQTVQLDYQSFITTLNKSAKNLEFYNISEMYLKQIKIQKWVWANFGEKILFETVPSSKGIVGRL